jgi:hypothetical protein
MQKIAKLTQRLILIAQKYSMVLFSSLMMAICALILIEDEKISDNLELITIKIIIISGLGISLFFGLNMFGQRTGKRWISELIGLIFLLGFYFILPSHKDNWNITQVILILACFVLSHLLVSFAPYWKSNDEASFWQYNKSLFIGLIQTGIFTQVLTIGVLLALAAIENLFGIDFKEKIYPEIAVFLSIFGSTVIFLLFQQGGLETMEANDLYPIILKFFTQFILIPLLLLYGVILYLYMFKILISFNLPQGWVSYLVLAYSIFGILALLLVHPLKNDSSKSWVRIFHKIFYSTLVPLIILLFIAINTRLLQYGFTEARYFVLLIACWLSVTVLYFIIKKQSSIKFIPISLFGFVLFALVFPYFNAFSLSIRSQEYHLKKLLKENHMLVNDKIDFKKEIADSVADNIEDKFEFLSKRFKNKSLASYLNEDIKKSFKNDKIWRINGLFTNINNKKRNNTYNSSFVLHNKNKYFKVENYNFVITQNQLDEKEITIGEDVFKLEHNCFINEPYYKLKINDKKTIDFMPLIIEKFKPYKNLSGEDTLEDLFVIANLGSYEIKIEFSSINKTIDNKTNNYYLENTVFFFKKKNTM